MKLHKLAWILVIIGGLNWGLEAFHTGLTAWLPWNVAMIIYIIVGLAALYELFTHGKNCKACSMKGGNM
jgi:uncharacterized membrane protein YuzA (DUF378 family)